MLSLVTAAEQQYRHDATARDRDLALIVSIRERRAAERASVAVVPRLRRAAWTRPIGVRFAQPEVCTTACAIA